MGFLEWASHNEELTVVGLVAVSITTLFATGILTSTVRRIWLGQQQLELKHAMVEQGMSPDDIERVLKT